MEMKLLIMIMKHNSKDSGVQRYLEESKYLLFLNIKYIYKRKFIDTV